MVDDEPPHWVTGAGVDSLRPKRPLEKRDRDLLAGDAVTLTDSAIERASISEAAREFVRERKAGLASHCKRRSVSVAYRQTEGLEKCKDAPRAGT